MVSQCPKKRQSESQFTEIIVIDESHKYAGWPQEVKNLRSVPVNIADFGRIFYSHSILARCSTFLKSGSPVTIVASYSRAEARTKQSAYEIGYTALYSEA